MDLHSEADFELRNRLKGIPRLLNPKDCNLGMAMRQLVKTYDAKPFLIGPHYHTFFRTTTYMECSIDMHQWVYLARRTMHTLLPEVPKMNLDFGIVLEARGDEVPERMMASARLSRIDPHRALHIEVPHRLSDT